MNRISTTTDADRTADPSLIMPFLLRSHGLAAFFCRGEIVFCISADAFEFENWDEPRTNPTKKVIHHLATLVNRHADLGNKNDSTCYAGDSSSSLMCFRGVFARGPPTMQ